MSNLRGLMRRVPTAVALVTVVTAFLRPLGRRRGPRTVATVPVRMISSLRPARAAMGYLLPKLLGLCLPIFWADITDDDPVDMSQWENRTSARTQKGKGTKQGKGTGNGKQKGKGSGGRTSRSSWQSGSTWYYGDISWSWPIRFYLEFMTLIGGRGLTDFGEISRMYSGGFILGMHCTIVSIPYD